jgi:hypothetical protein
MSFKRIRHGLRELESTGGHSVDEARLDVSKKLFYPAGKAVDRALRETQRVAQTFYQFRATNC